jgi:hypothetical protein
MLVPVRDDNPPDMLNETTQLAGATISTAAPKALDP